MDWKPFIFNHSQQQYLEYVSFRAPCWRHIASDVQMRQSGLKMAEMDFKTATSTMEALARISVSISLFTLPRG